jgi:PiT family inorganic phosphate transporter
LHSFTDQIGAAFINSFATFIGAPTSTTQVVTATLMGVGAAEKPKHVKWNTALSIIKGWLVNVPVSIVLGCFYCAIFLFVGHFFHISM